MLLFFGCAHYRAERPVEHFRGVASTEVIKIPYVTDAGKFISDALNVTIAMEGATTPKEADALVRMFRSAYESKIELAYPYADLEQAKTVTTSLLLDMALDSSKESDPNQRVVLYVMNYLQTYEACVRKSHEIRLGSYLHYKETQAVDAHNRQVDARRDRVGNAFRQWEEQRHRNKIERSLDGIDQSLRR